MDITLGLAQVFVAPLVGTISDYYGHAILEKIGIKWDVTEEMETLSDILVTIQDVLEDAEDKQTTSKRIGLWLKKLKKVAYEVQDILDLCATEEALHKRESTEIINEAAMVDKFNRFFSINNVKEIAEQSSMTKRIKELINKFQEIADQSSKFNLNNLSSTKRVVNYRVDPRPETISFLTESKVYGRYEEKERIVNLMVNNINAGNLSIYAIVGMGGLGKTTLAKMVYNDNMVTSHFKIIRWVCVSENFEVKSLIGDIIQLRSDDQTSQQLQCRLQEEFSEKRFLIVLDDVWNEDAAKWETLKSLLLCGAKGSSIIVTTRSGKVASLMAGSSHDQVFHPKMLSEEDCFSLFKHRAFAEGEGEHHPNLESIGKEIVKKCGGVPLAAKALGGLLRFKREEKEWLFVKESKLWNLPQDKEDSILPALWLSYKHLPQHLRQCFAYCSIFPKDYIMEKELLIQLWMANCFLQPKGNMELEDIGNEVFSDLVWRGFFQEVSKDHSHNTVCKMHDLVHDLACSITRDECVSVVNDADKELVVGRLKTTRHLTILNHILVSPNFSLSNTQPFLRTYLRLDKIHWRHNIVPLLLYFSNLKYLRVLDLRGTRVVETALESIARLKLLRYLDLSQTDIAILSDKVFGNLINLQTLKLCVCKKLEMLPGNMRKLTNLRHLDMRDSTEKLVRMPVGMGQLKSLHKLSHFIVSEDSGCGVGELEELDHLGGSLEISWLWKVKDVRDAENAKLSRKENIRDLLLDWLKTSWLKTYVLGIRDVPAESQTNSMNDNDKSIADALQPHPNIKKLEFYNYGGSDFPRWMNSTCLFSLETLDLFKCSKCKHLPPTLGLLPHLKKLSLESIPMVECIGNEFYCDEEEEEGNNMMMKAPGMVLFPALEELKLKKMLRLEEWKGWSSSSRMKGGGEAQVSSVFPVLKTLTIYNCPDLSTIPPLPMSLEDLDINNCPALELLPNDFQNLVSLKYLYIEAALPNFPEGILLQNSLESLNIERCDGLKSLNNCLQLLTNLGSLIIRNCPALELLPDDFQSLVSLQSLHLRDLPKLTAVPVLGSTTLTFIHFSKCAGLTNLPEWITNLKSLTSLHLIYCKNLKSLPEGLQHLTALETLYINDCHPELDRRCQENTGEDWHKIAHIPYFHNFDSSDSESD